MHNHRSASILSAIVSAIGAAWRPLTPAAGVNRRSATRSRYRTFDSLEPRMMMSTYTVTSLLDPSTLTAGTLRYEVQQALTAGGTNTVAFTAGLSGTVSLTSPLAITNSNLTISGTGATISLTSTSNVATVSSGFTLTLNSLTVTGTTSTAVTNAGTLNLTGDTFSTDKSNGSGGAVKSSGALNIDSVDFTGDTANAGGAIAVTAGSLTVSNSTFASSSAHTGGAIDIYFDSTLGGTLGSLSVATTTFSGDSSTSDGGAIYTNSALTVTGSVFTGDSATLIGGAIAATDALSSTNGLVLSSDQFDNNSTGTISGSLGGAIASSQSVTASNSLFFENLSNAGGAIEMLAPLTSSTAAPALVLVQTAFVNNSADLGAAINSSSGNVTITQSDIIGNTSEDEEVNSEGAVIASGTIALNNSIVATNSGGNLGSSASGSNNLVGDGENISGSSNLTGSTESPLDPHVLALANNGGTVPTLALNVDSPAVNAGSNALAVGTDGTTALTTDAAGNARIVLGTVDIGETESVETSNQRYVIALYTDLLHRDYDQAGLDQKVAELAAGESKADIATGFTTSTEYLTNVVTADYGHILGRTPSSDEITYWIGQLENGVSPDAMQATIYGSAEYFYDVGSTNTLYVDALYKSILNRVPPDADAASWVNELTVSVNPLTRAEVAGDIASGFEANALTIDNEYAFFLGRTPSADEMTQFQAILANGISDIELTNIFVTSPEYLAINGVS